MDHFSTIKQCTRCELRESATNVVVGSGPVQSRYMIIGEAPGYHEDISGQPFVGKTGNYLFEKLWEIGLSRDLFYVTNVLKCRPPDNADPTKKQIRACTGNLRLQLKVIMPRLIIPVGAFALSKFSNEKISQIHGNLIPWPDGSFRLFPIYHPSHALRKKKTVEPVFLKDLKELKRVIDKMEAEVPDNILFRRR